MAQQIKPFSVGLLRQITDYYDEGKISYGRMVEILNEIAIEWHNSTIFKIETTQNMAQVTAVEWLIESLLSIYTNEGLSYNQKAVDAKLVIDKAKAMEKEQIKTAFFEGTCDWRKPYLENMQKAEKYYNVTYKS